MHVGTILRQYVCRVVSSSTINRLFLGRPLPPPSKVICFIAFSPFLSGLTWCSLAIPRSRARARRLLIQLYMWCAHTSIYIYRPNCLLSVVEMIIINDHGSLVVCCWQYLFLNTCRYIFISICIYIHARILQWERERERSRTTKLDVVNSRLGLFVESCARARERERKNTHRFWLKKTLHVDDTCISFICTKRRGEKK